MRKAISKLLKPDRDRSRSVSASRNSSRPPTEGEEHDTQPPAPVPVPESEPAAESSPGAIEAATCSVSETLWSRAYELLSEREPELVQDYELHIASREGNEDRASADATRRAILSNPESVTEVVHALQDKREKKQWRFTIKGKSHKAKDQLERLVKLLSIADGVVKQAVSTQPYAALAWSTVSVFLPLIKTSFSKDEAMVQGFTIIGELQLYWKNCEASFLQSTYSQYYQSLVTPLSNVYSYILEYQVSAICYLSKKQLSRAWEKLSGQYDWATKEAYIVKLSEACNAQIQPLQRREAHQKFQKEMGKLDQIHQVGADIVETIKDENQKHREDALMDKLEIGAGDYLGGMNFNKDPVKGTCEWFYNGESLSNWLTSEGSCVFWVTAGPGCGKSVLARSLIKHGHLQSTTTTVDIEAQSPIKSTESIICYFFFKDEAAERMSTSTALCAILHQLFCQDPTNKLIKRASDPSNRDARPSPRSFESLWETLLIVAESHTGGDIICVLDALDECRIDDRDQFIARLDQFHADQKSSLNNLKFLITSRPYDDIELSFSPFLKRTEFFRFDADEHYKDISHDIGLVIDEMMHSFASNFDEADHQKIVDELKSRGTNTYLWLHLTLDIMKKHPSRYSRRRDVQTFLADLPSRVSEAYEKILSRTKSERTTKTLLQIMLAAERALTVEEANYALTLALADHEIKTHSELDSERWKGDFKSIVKNFCGLIVSVYDGKLSFIHLTVREFLTKKSDSATRGWGGQFADPSALHGILARCCMQYLLLSEFAFRQLPTVKGEEYEYRLLKYAAVSWPEHFKALDEATKSSCLSQARQLCDTAQPPLRTWGSFYMQANRTRFSFSKSFYNWSNLAVASFVGLRAVVEDLVENVGVNVNELCGGFGTALSAAVVQDQEDIVAYLISKGAEVDKMPPREEGTALDIAVGITRHHGIVQLLVEKGASPFIKSKYGRFFQSRSGANILACAAVMLQTDIFYTMLASLVDISTSDGILLAVTDERIIESGDECVALLLNRLDDEQFVNENILTEDRLKTLVSVPSVGERALTEVQRRNWQHLFFQKSILENAFKITGIAAFLKTFLVQGSQPCTNITQEVLEIIAQFYDPDTMRLFIQFSPQDRCTIKTLILFATENEIYYDTMSQVVLEFAKADLMADEELQKELLTRYYRPGQKEAVVKTFLQLSRLTPSITTRLIQLALRCYRYDDRLLDNSLLRSVLEHGGRSAIVNSRLLKDAVRNSSPSAVQLLLEYNSEASLADEQYLIAAAKNIYTAREMMEFILSRHGSSSVITSNVARVAAGRYDNLFRWLLETRSEQVLITCDIVSCVAAYESFEAIVQHRRDDIAQIACETLHKVANPQKFHHDVMENLLYCCPAEWFEPTETLILDTLERDVVVGPAINRISLLIRTVGDKIVITEAILAATVSSRCRGIFADIFKNWKPEHFKITPWIIEKAAVAGTSWGLEYLINASEGTLKIDEKLYRLALFQRKVRTWPWKGYEKAWSQELDSNAKDAHGKTALHIASSEFGVPPKLVRFLLEETHADVHAVDRRGWTPLHFAVLGNEIKIVQMLLAAGADPNKAALNGDTPISLVTSDWEEDTSERMNQHILLLMLNDDWFAGFMDPAFGLDSENPYDEADLDSDDDSTDS